MGKRSTQEDVQLGNNIRVRRMMLKISQTGLGNALGLSFQQVQKYEKGANRVGAVRLQEIATALETTPAELMSKAAGDVGLSVVKAAERSEFMAAIATDQYAFDLAVAFIQVQGDRRALVVQLVRALAANRLQQPVATPIPTK